MEVRVKNSVDKVTKSEYNETSRNIKDISSMRNDNSNNITKNNNSIKITSSYLVQNPSEQEIKKLQVDIEHIFLLSIGKHLA